LCDISYWHCCEHIRPSGKLTLEDFIVTTFNKIAIVTAVSKAFDIVENAQIGQSDAGKAFRAARSNLWTETCKNLCTVPVDQLDNVCADIREPKRDKKAFKTLTNNLSTASAAIKLGVSLFSEKGEVLARGKVETANTNKRLETPEGKAAAAAAAAAAEITKASEVRNYDMHDIANVLKLLNDPMLAVQFAPAIASANAVALSAIASAKTADKSKAPAKAAEKKLQAA
jgi:hypothetical protein